MRIRALGGVGRWRLWLVCLLLAMLYAPKAHAYPWMMRHSYQQCAPCHLDPSGGGPLTRYGRAMGEELLRTKYPFEPEQSEDLAAGKFLWGVELPNAVLLGGDFRALALRQKVEGSAAKSDFIWMQSDLSAGLNLDGFVAAGTLGYADRGALPASLTRGEKHNLVSRQHWLGYRFGNWGLVRAGRMNLPFGIRNIEHTLWTRAYTRTDTNDTQQYGLSFAYQGDRLRGEAMAIAGNFQLRPDVYRERGYSLFVEYLPIDRLAVGASSLITHRELDPRLFREDWRHAHGVFGRWATPWKPLVLLSEWDYSYETPKGTRHVKGNVAYLQSDFELVQGVHLMVTGEANNVGIGSVPASFSGWFTYWWFLAPHADLRFDAIFQSLGGVLYRTEVQVLLAQLHVYL